ncbi:MAG: hypothetical protein M3Q07_11570 [Pseudobdellovibrionaceae bacterium]|nr:hypothetical protein [Pseudobdellovibrionaceae bacterium]
MNKVFLGLLWMGTTVQASSFQEYCSNGMATVKIAHGHIQNEISVTERIRKDWAYVDQKVILQDASITILEVTKLENHKDNICEGKWGIFYWRNVFYKKIRIARQDGILFSLNILGSSKDGRFVEASIICEEHGNSEIICDDPSQTP